MTLILSCMTHEYVVQVSDRRLTNIETGSVEEDQSNKTLFFCGQTAFAYTGLSRLGGLPTAEWLLKYLARATSLPDAMTTITKTATSDLIRISFPSSISTEERRRRRRIAFVGVGFAMPAEGLTRPAARQSPIDVDPIRARVPVMVLSSNFFQPPGNWLSLAERKLSWVQRILARGQSHSLFPTGQRLTRPEYDDLDRRIRRYVEHETSAFPVALAMVRAVRAVAQRNPLVGKNLMCMVIPRSGVTPGDARFESALVPLSDEHADESQLFRPLEAYKDRKLFFYSPESGFDPVYQGPYSACAGMEIKDVVFGPSDLVTPPSP
jgi:hypothetical protein